MREYDVLAFIGRFQPFHMGHMKVVLTALEKADRVVLIVGSDQQPRNSRNPWTAEERFMMARAVFREEIESERLIVLAQVDHTYNLDRWIAEVTAKVESVARRIGWKDKGPKIGLIGHNKDKSSFYLKCFPRWGSVEVKNDCGTDATTIREALFDGKTHSLRSALVMPSAVVDYLLNWRVENRSAYLSIVEEMDFVRSYKKQFESLPYPPTFNTVDAIVVQSGHILLVKRGAQPGKGLWALPGGFIQHDEFLLDAAIRELREETRLAVPAPVIRGSLVEQRCFDDPHRSLRGRTITNAFYFRLPNQKDLPKVKGSDDAEKAKWVALGSLDRSIMYEDHYEMISTMVGI